jgi:sugar lactone lactonase YvrE
LSNRSRIPLGFAPDGIAIDPWGCIWSSDVFGRAAQRVTSDGMMLDRIPTPQLCLACAVGGPSERDLFLCSSPSLDSEECLKLMQSRIEATVIGPPQ